MIDLDNKSGGGNGAEVITVVSPCISICALDQNNICTGCHRSGEEIRQWMSLGNDDRWAVLKKAQVRGKKGNPFA